jgi:hypothetical protein
MEKEAPQRTIDALMTGSQAARCHNMKCPGSGHNLHMDNPVGLCNMIINEFLQENREVLEPQEVEIDLLTNFDEDLDSVAADMDNMPMTNAEELEMPLMDQKEESK